ncbi:hypothetical protein Q5H92_08955 [Hymenobacter sp. M29]|uniref:Uncharacterized protein n=1 Tax=Hymenobacter mellowenesis TaxID=3063995 RepID=A0ABT9AAU2_9BACT|nr:hypothetical protein [Hymenobacter sp. M29]MDO7846484.1 hypothetical protein [Hymenobacter sp. M29]
MSGRNSKTAGAAVAAAPAPVVNQTAATAGEAGLPIVAPPAEQPAEPERPAEEEEAEPAERVFQLDRFTEAIESLSDEDFMLALEAMYGEGYRRDLLTIDKPHELESKPETPEVAADTVAEAAPVDEHAETRELLGRFNLKRAWRDADGVVHFDEKAARKAAGDNADSLTVIEA